jgi:hypothetical protein
MFSWQDPQQQQRLRNLPQLRSRVWSTGKRMCAGLRRAQRSQSPGDGNGTDMFDFIWLRTRFGSMIESGNRRPDHCSIVAWCLVFERLYSSTS